LVFHGIDIPYTHNIGRLLLLCERIDLCTEEIIEVKILTPYAITLRYPGNEDDITEIEADQSVQIAEKLRAS